MNRMRDLSDLKVGKLTVLSPASKNRQRSITWLCICSGVN